MRGLGFLHTAASHVPRFGSLAKELAPAVSVVHAVHAELLEDARRSGVDGPLTLKLRGVLEALAQEAAVIVCTCSTLGAAAEALDRRVGARVLRVDRPLAAVAVTQGPRIAIVVALESTLSATRELLEEEAQRAGRPLRLETVFAPDAWALFERGDLEGYHQSLASVANEAAANADVIVLAQASMMGAERWVSAPIPVLSSPRVGVEAARALLQGEPGIRSQLPELSRIDTQKPEYPGVENNKQGE